ncbi:MAG TPA: glutaminyl-peptide cyclotransferase [Chloroflexi bacterium]|nr:glutaminyl-peptide cyclotransferase [Chloroflexota bacterium]
MRKIQPVLNAILIALILLLSACNNDPTATQATTKATPSPTQTIAPASTPLPTPPPTAANTPQPQFNSPVSPVNTPDAAKEIQHYTYRIINTYPHDPTAFTQGLLPLDGIFYEGTGLYGRSSLRKVEPESGKVLQQINLAPTLFGEGITIFGDKLYQLTWKSKVGFVYNKDSFDLLQEFYYPTEGWGITHDGQKLIMSDGSDTLYFRDPETLEEVGRARVFDDKGPVVRLNELEYVKGEIFANIWQTNRIAIINPKTGQVTGWIDFSGILSAKDITQPVDVLNGIAYNAETGQLFVTGKLWPKLFEVELVPVE